MSKTATVVIVGRINVGKSTLFNRLATNKRSIALDYSGVTRDFITDTVSWNDTVFTIIDTGGMSLRKTQDPMLEKVRAVAENQVASCDIVLFMCDGTVGVLPEDKEIARSLRKMGKQVILVVNKADSSLTQNQLFEFEKLGFKDLCTLSAQHGTGMAELLEAITGKIRMYSTKEEEKPAYSVVLLGKPNVGKSSLMNLLAKQERSIVLDMPGTTREALSQEIQFYNKKIELVDTPGIRRKRSVGGDIEPLMVKSSFAALKDADIVMLLIDATEGTLVDQELKLAFYAFQEQCKALILLINKQDLATADSERELEVSLDLYKHIIDEIPFLKISCKTEKNVGKIVPMLDKVWERYSQRFDNEEITQLFMSNLSKKPLFYIGQRLILYKVEQIKTAPITFVLTVNRPNWFGESQLGFFENILRKEYDLKGVPVKFIPRAKYSEKKIK
jgi:GTP-binding protein